MSCNVAWNYYEKGDRVRAAGVMILEQRYRARTMPLTTYLVRMLCCGDEREMNHSQIRDRARRAERGTSKFDTCVKCRARTGKKKPRHTVRSSVHERQPLTAFMAPPTWPIPALRPDPDWRSR